MKEGKTVLIRVGLTREEKQRMATVAKSAGKTLATWARDVLALAYAKRATG